MEGSSCYEVNLFLKKVKVLARVTHVMDTIGPFSKRDVWWYSEFWHDLTYDEHLFLGLPSRFQ